MCIHWGYREDDSLERDDFLSQSGELRVRVGGLSQRSVQQLGVLSLLLLQRQHLATQRLVSTAQREQRAHTQHSHSVHVSASGRAVD